MKNYLITILLGSLLSCTPRVLLAQEVDTCEYDTTLIYTHVLSENDRLGLAGKFGDSYTPTPEAAGIMQYTPSSIVPYTGTAYTTIPLYTIENGKFSLPIYLSYASTGIKVAQEATRFGLGWSLFAGGMISREVFKEDDLNSSTGYEKYYPKDHHNSATIYAAYEPDVFSYHFGAYSGKFYLAKEYFETVLHSSLNKDTIQIQKHFISSKPQDNLTITYDSISQTFCIVTPELVKYYFRDKEVVQKRSIVGDMFKNVMQIDGVDIPSDSLSTSTMMSLDYVPDFSTNTKVTTAWYLSEIQFPNGESISFLYDILTDSYLSPMRKDYISLYTTRGGMGHIHKTFDVLNWERTNEQPVLRKITWKNGEVEFVPSSSSRTDIRPYLSGDEDCPTEYMYVRSSDGTQVKGIRFHHSYYSSNNTWPYSTQHIPYLCNRLRLDSISVLGTESGELSYTFSYDHSGNLPAKNIPYTDRWGYFTGVVKNVIPVDVISSKRLLSTYSYKEVQNKFTPYPVPNEHSKTWSLTSIKNPAGALTEFEYEPHSVRCENRQLVKDTIMVEITKPYMANTLDTIIYISGKGLVGIDYEYISQPIHLDPYPLNPSLDDNAPASWKDKEARTKLIQTLGSPYLSITGFHDGFQCDTINGQEHITAYFEKSFKVKSFLKIQLRTQCEAEVKLKLTFFRTTPEVPAGGIRLKEMRSPEGITRYCYAPGKIMRDPASALNIRVGNRSYTEFHSSPFQAMRNSYTDISVGYDSVCVERYAGGICINRDSIFYHNDSEGVLDETTMGRPLPKNGLPLKSLTYVGDRKQKCLERHYVRNNVDCITLARGNDSRKTIYEIGAIFTPLTLQREEVYDIRPSSLASQTTITSFSYSPTLHLPNEVKTTQDAIESSSVHLVYSGESTRFSIWKEHGRLTLPVEETYERNGVPVRRIVRTYSPDSLALPKEEYDFLHLKDSLWPLSDGANHQETSPWEYTPTLTYTSYDSAGRCTSMKTRMGQSAVHLWGYRHQYLIAEIQNATLEDVVAQGVDVEALADKPQPDGADWTLLKSLRTTLPQSAVTIYQYKPLIGVSSSIDPAGIEHRYAYDTFGRLISESVVENGSEHAIKKYEYNYATEH